MSFSGTVGTYQREMSTTVVSYTVHCTVLIKDGKINGTVDQDELICDVDLTCQAQVPASNKAISNHLRCRGGHRKGLNARVVPTSLDDSVTGLILAIGHWLLVRGYHDRRGDGDAKGFRHHLEFPLLLFLTEPKFSTAPIRHRIPSSSATTNSGSMRGRGAPKTALFPALSRRLA